MVQITFGVICHARVTHQDACEAELAKCRTNLGAAKADDVVPLAAVAAETGTPSSAFEGARLRPTIRLACEDSVRTDARALRVCARSARAVQGHVRSSSRT